MRDTAQLLAMVMEGQTADSIDRECRRRGIPSPGQILAAIYTRGYIAGLWCGGAGVLLVLGVIWLVDRFLVL